MTSTAASPGASSQVRSTGPGIPPRSRATGLGSRMTSSSTVEPLVRNSSGKPGSRAPAEEAVPRVALRTSQPGELTVIRAMAFLVSDCVPGLADRQRRRRANASHATMTPSLPVGHYAVEHRAAGAVSAARQPSVLATRQHESRDALEEQETRFMAARPHAFVAMPFGVKPGPRD